MVNSMPELVTLYQTGGVVLVFIGFQVWLIKYFMRKVNDFTMERRKLMDDFAEERRKTQEIFDTALVHHCNMVSSSLNETAKCSVMLYEKIDVLIDIYRKGG